MTFYASLVTVDDETVLSQARRLAAANGLITVKELLRRATDSGTIPTPSRILAGAGSDWLARFARHTSTPLQHAEAGTRLGGRYPSLRSWARPRATRTMTYCMACLTDVPAWKLAWQLPYMNACEEHQLLLVNHVTRCTSNRALPQQWLVGSGPLRCCTVPACRGRLLDDNTTVAPPDVLAEQRRWLDLDLDGRIELLSARRGAGTERDHQNDPDVFRLRSVIDPDRAYDQYFVRVRRRP